MELSTRDHPSAVIPAHAKMTSMTRWWRPEPQACSHLSTVIPAEGESSAFDIGAIADRHHFLLSVGIGGTAKNSLDGPPFDG